MTAYPIYKTNDTILLLIATTYWIIPTKQAIHNIKRIPAVIQISAKVFNGTPENHTSIVNLPTIKCFPHLTSKRMNLMIR